MSNTLKFTGTFKNLKGMDCEFLKLYARNYKVYLKELGGRSKFWIWVAQGGYIEFADFHSNTKNFIEALKSINWDEIKATPFLDKKLKQRHVRFNNGEPSKGYEIAKDSMEFERMFAIRDKEEEMKLERNGLYDKKYEKEYKELRAELEKDFNRDFFITEESAKEILEVYEQLQSS